MIKTLNIEDAHAQLLKLLSYALDGNEVIIMKDSMPLARLVPAVSNNQPRIAGLSKGKISISDDFDKPLPDAFWVDSK